MNFDVTWYEGVVAVGVYFIGYYTGKIRTLKKFQAEIEEELKGILAQAFNQLDENDGDN